MLHVEGYLFKRVGRVLSGDSSAPFLNPDLLLSMLHVFLSLCDYAITTLLYVMFCLDLPDCLFGGSLLVLLGYACYYLAHPNPAVYCFTMLDPATHSQAPLRGYVNITHPSDLLKFGHRRRAALSSDDPDSGVPPIIFRRTTPEAMPILYSGTNISTLLHPQVLKMMQCFSTFMLCCTPCLLPSLLDSGAILMVFLLGLCLLYAPTSLFDELSHYTFKSSSDVMRHNTKRRRRSKWKRAHYWRIRWRHQPLSGRLKFYKTMDEFGIPFERPAAFLRRKFARRNHRARQRWRSRKKKERNEAAIANFLTPLPVVPPWTSDEIPIEVLNEFCSGDRGQSFLAFPQLLNQFTLLDHAQQAEQAVNRANIFRVALENRHHKPKEQDSSFTGCPLVWDTGASFGLTPFRADFIDYVECRIPVKDISKTNMVIGIGTTLHKYTSEGTTYWLPCLSYHLPTADIRLFSPQVYHTLYGGNSTVEGDRVIMHIGDMNTGFRADVKININREGANVPLIYDVSCTKAEMHEVSPHINSALPRMERRTDFFGSYSNDNYVNWQMDTIEDEFDQYAGFCGPCVASDGNENLTNAEKELLLTHWKLGVSMPRCQELMREIPMEDPAGVTTIATQVIKPRYAGAATCRIPICQSCQLARAHQRKPNVQKTKAVPESAGALSREKVEVGDFVSMDQYVVRTPGRLPTGYGREPDTSKFHGGTIFRDAASKIIHVENQVSLGAGDTIQAKIRFEDWLYNEAATRVKHYHSDNGVFTAELFTKQCSEDGQTQSFSGVGAQHQNAEAERAIQTIMYMARSFMIHAGLHWTTHNADNLAQWSFAVDHAAWLYNRIPQRKSGISPLEFLTAEREFYHRDLRRAHVWGCPVYVLEPELQDGKKLPKWNRRARMGQFLGFSKQHSSLVALVRNLHTNYVSPQYHLVFDDKFDTIFQESKTEEELELICQDLFESNRDCYVDPEGEFDDGILVYKPPPLDEVWLSDTERRERKAKLSRQRQRHAVRERTLQDKRQTERRSPLPDLVSESDSDSDDDFDDDPSSQVDSRSEGDILEGPTMWQDHPHVSNEPETIPIVEPDPAPNIPNAPNIVPEGDNSGDIANEGAQSRREPRRRSRRVRVDDPSVTPPRRSRLDTPGTPQRRRNRRSLGGLRKQPRVKYNTILNNAEMPLGVRNVMRKRKKQTFRKRMTHLQVEGDRLLNQQELTDINGLTVEDIMDCPLSKYVHFTANDMGYTGSRLELVTNLIHPLFLKARSEASREDNPNWREAMNGQFSDSFWDACYTELETLEEMEAWDVVDRPEGANVIASIWAFKIKRFPDGLIKKFKARFCARGDQQIEGIDFFETYAPVVQWTTIRLMLILEVLLDLQSKQGDVTAAFLHAKLNDGETIFVEMPTGFRKHNKVLKLKRTLYGLRQSPREFWKYLTDAMKQCDMVPSKMDPCLFVGPKVLAICYVDDIIFWAKDEDAIYELGIQLRSKELLLEEEDDAAGFLGVRLDKLEDGKINMTQTGLTDRIIETLGLDTKMSKNKYTPAEAKPLPRDDNGEPPSNDFSYASVVGMLLYLSGHTRPDIAYAVNCCARYMFCPRKSHEIALKRIGRYLKATRTKGLILDPCDELCIDNYPDADFAGMYGHEVITDPACVKSRTGFIITVANCPVLWMSKLQQETALSTMEAEIIALAHSCRELFPIMDMVTQLGPKFGLKTEDMTTIKVSIHEDNAGALILAKTIPPQHTPRSKYYAIKTVWFREEIVKRGISLMKIDTVEQLGDIFTKGVPKATLEYLRKRIMGW